MKTIKISVIEDEPQSLSLILNYLQELGQPYEVVSATDNVAEAILQIKTHQPDVLVSDIRIKDGDIFEVLEQTEQYVRTLVLITAYEHYAIKAFKYSAIDYLLKPINLQDLQMAIEKCVRQLDFMQHSPVSQFRFLRSQRTAETINPASDILINSGHSMTLLKQSEIIYCKADRNYTEFHMVNGKVVLSSKTLLFYEQLVDPAVFFRIHLSYIVNVTYITKVEKARTGKVVMKNGEVIDVASRRLKPFSDFLKKNNIR